MKPESNGYYWYLPSEECAKKLSLLPDRSIVCRVYNVELIWCVELPLGPVDVSKIDGDWEPIIEPNRMVRESANRIVKRIKNRFAQQGLDWEVEQQQQAESLRG
jgi:hypothetical protein